jgi:dethiobiotin synthetase
MAKKQFFIAGTDTDAGKTLVASGILEKARQMGLQTLAAKPVASGCEQTPEGLRNSDALSLMDAMTGELAYEQVNPMAFEPAIAPHIAAMRANKNLSVDRLVGYCNGVMMRPSDLVIIEGAGGWRVPLNPRETLADLVKQLNIPVILVVGVKLGCINHALLTVEAIERDGLQVAGWVANRIDPQMSCYDENMMTLRRLISAPCLGEIPFLDIADKKNAADHLDLTAALSESI